MDNLDILREWTGTISNIANAYKKSRILFTAFKAGVFDLLETPRAVSEVARDTGWSERGTAMLLDGLVALELIEKSNNKYNNMAHASACLTKNGCAYQGNILCHTINSWDDWAALEERVRTGTCATKGERREGDELRDFILGMENIARLSAREVLQMVDLSQYRHVLDLAGGPATYSIAFLDAVPEMRATLFDMPAVIDIARERVALSGKENRFSYIAGDCLVDHLGSGYDLAFMSNIIHSFSTEENKMLVKRVYDALAPGGTILIKDFIVENDRSGPAFSLIFALHMLVHTPAGGTYSFDEVKAWTDAAGFQNGRAMSLTPQTRLWLAEKSA